MKKYSYVLITPVKNEEQSLPNVINSIINQTIKPNLWLLINDGSIDNTEKIITDAINKNHWIRYLYLPPSRLSSLIRYSFVCKKGFEKIQELCTNENITYNYIGLLDADIIPEKEYYEQILKKFCNNTKLGITGGGIYIKKKKKYIIEKSNSNRPRGGNRLWSINCFRETKGYIITAAPDTVSDIKSINLGYSIQLYPEIKSIQTRPTSSVDGLWNGYKNKGEGSYYLGEKIINVLLKGILFLFSYRTYLAFAYWIGYFRCIINKTKKIQDKEIIIYYKNWSIISIFK